MVDILMEELKNGKMLENNVLKEIIIHVFYVEKEEVI